MTVVSRRTVAKADDAYPDARNALRPRFSFLIQE